MRLPAGPRFSSILSSGLIYSTRRRRRAAQCILISQVWQGRTVSHSRRPVLRSAPALLSTRSVSSFLVQSRLTMGRFHLPLTVTLTLALLLLACSRANSAPAPPTVAPFPNRIVFIRHAEKGFGGGNGRHHPLDLSDGFPGLVHPSFRMASATRANSGRNSFARCVFGPGEREKGDSDLLRTAFWQGFGIRLWSDVCGASYGAGEGR